MKSITIVLSLSLASSLSLAFPVGYCADQAINQAEETSDFIPDGYIHHKDFQVLDVIVTANTNEREGIAILQSVDGTVAKALMKVVKSEQNQNESCQIEIAFLKRN